MTAFVIVCILVVVLVLWFAVLKPKQPKVSAQQVTLIHLYADTAGQLNVTLGLLVRVDNPNHASYRYENTTAYISYRSSPVAEAPIEHDAIPARGDLNISSDMVLDAHRLLATAGFDEDFAAGCFNFSSSTTLHGRAKVLNLFKLTATTNSTCHISVYIASSSAIFVCDTKFKY